MAKNPVTGSDKQVTSKTWPAVSGDKADSALIGGVRNGTGNTRTAPKGKGKG
jgi:hypothetical protein